MDDLLNKLSELLQDEKKTDQLTKIPKTIYRDTARHIRSFRSSLKQQREDLPGRIAAKERELIVRLVQRLLESRLTKVLEGGGEISTENLTSEEKYVFDPIESSRKRMKRIVAAIGDGQTSVLEFASKIVASRYTVVRFLQPLPATMGTDLVKYGPFHAEDVAMLPAENAKPLIKQGIVEEIWVEE